MAQTITHPRFTEPKVSEFDFGWHDGWAKAEAGEPMRCGPATVACEAGWLAGYEAYQQARYQAGVAEYEASKRAAGHFAGMVRS